MWSFKSLESILLLHCVHFSMYYLSQLVLWFLYLACILVRYSPILFRLLSYWNTVFLNMIFILGFAGIYGD